MVHEHTVLWWHQQLKCQQGSATAAFVATELAELNMYVCNSVNLETFPDCLKSMQWDPSPDWKSDWSIIYSDFQIVSIIFIFHNIHLPWDACKRQCCQNSQKQMLNIILNDKKRILVSMFPINFQELP